MGGVGVGLGWVLVWVVVGLGLVPGPDKDLGPDKNLVPNVSGGWGWVGTTLMPTMALSHRSFPQGRVWQL